MKTAGQDLSEVNGVKVQIDIRPVMQSGKYSQSDGITLLLARKGTAHIEVDFTVYQVHENDAITFAPKSTVRFLDQDDEFRCCILSFDNAMAIEALPRPEPSFIDFMRCYPMGTIPPQRAE